MALAEDGDLAAAATEARRAVELAPGRPGICYNLVRASK